MKKVILAFLIVLFIYLVPSVSARSGCCSWHGGVCGCGCCDGSSLSSTCAPYYPQCSGGYEYKYVPSVPTPTPIVIPTSVKGGSTYTYNNSTQSYDVTFNWDDWSQSTGWSINLSQYAGSDPGPDMDTTSSVWTFKNVYPGTKYVNIKAAVQGYWSRVSYWIITVPPIPTATPFPTPTPTPIPTLIPTGSFTRMPTTKLEESKNKVITKKSFWQWLFGL